MMTRDRYAGGQTFDQMVATAKKNVELWTLTRRRAKADPVMIGRVEALGLRLHLVVLSEDWCIDSVSSLPFIAALAEQAANLDLRILGRDANLDLMDAHLHMGRSRSIPCVIAYDDSFTELGWWGPRPADLQRLVSEDWHHLTKVERVAEERHWYGRDRGVSPVREIVTLLERCAIGASGEAAPQTVPSPDEVITSASAE